MVKTFVHVPGAKEWSGNNKEIIFSKNQRLNEFIFASEFLQDAKDMRMLKRKGKLIMTGIWMSC
ncbi:MAG: hypothetical protein WDM90_02625 [Ferruginibacter sp.]